MELRDDIFRFIYISAMRDATLQGAYNVQKAWLAKETGAAEAFIRKHVESVMTGQYWDLDQEGHDQERYDQDFLNLAKDVTGAVNCAEKKNGVPTLFAFGNAQKLINISLKYVYIVELSNPEYQKFFSCCHCPMDQVLLEHVWTNRKILNAWKQASDNDRKRDGFLKSWGNENFEDGNLPSRYRLFQDCVKELAGEDMSRLDYDFSIWNKMKGE